MGDNVELKAWSPGLPSHMEKEETISCHYHKSKAKCDGIEEKRILKKKHAQVPCRSFLSNRFFELDFARATKESVVAWAHHWYMQVTKQQLLVGFKILDFAASSY